MAEIIVEPDNRDPNKDKRSSPSIWPWILGALLLFGLIWAVIALTGDDEPEREVATTTAVERQPAVNDNTYAGAVAAGPVAEFIRFANDDERYERENVANTDATVTTDNMNPDANQADQAEMGLDHEYTSEGINKLSAALYALADNSAGDTNIQQSRDRFQQKADQLQRDPQSLQHANMIRETFVEASNLMATIKERSYPDSDANVDDVKKAAEGIDINTPTLEQKDKVKDFFSEAGDSIEEMAKEANMNIDQNNGVNTSTNR